ncbi:MAG TPA: NADH-quinone oxidoreductase subunit C [Caldithrix abyssi]|uniref:NADH-quinone oxidoreductase subunit C n=1 Tax=Caldithrix abyssi TaxID=187145 RepID=A0A7V4WVM4_CALAY|nr:NADH-quinone oxidoreductase subunit C [Caldithrix abyssi]
MTAQEIYDTLKKKFPDTVLEFNSEALQPFIKLDAEKQFYELCQFLRDDEAMDFDFLRCLSGVDYGEPLGAVYHLFSMKHRHEIVLKIEVAREGGKIPSVADLWRTADWHEREIFDLYGITFTNHPNLKRILLPDDWEGHPLRKDYVTPEYYNGIPILHPDTKGKTNE